MRARLLPAAVARPSPVVASPRHRVTVIVTRIMRRQGQAVSSTEGKYVAGNYRRRVTLPSRRFAMIVVGFEMVSRRPARAASI